MKITPLTIQRMSSDWWNHRFRLILRRLLLRGDQNAVGRFSVRTCSPLRMISTIRNTLKKCCHPSHGGIPTGAPSGSGYSPGYVMRNSCMNSRLRNHLTNSTAMPAANSSPAPPTITAPAHCTRVNGP